MLFKRPGQAPRGQIPAKKATSSIPDTETVSLDVLDTNFQAYSVDQKINPGTSQVNVSWGDRQALSSERWSSIRDSLVRALMSSEVLEPACKICSKRAVIHCQACMPKEFLCSECDEMVHAHLVLHDRSATIKGFHQPISPTTVVQPEGDTFKLTETVRFLPISIPKLCGCCPSALSMTAAKGVILVGMNGRYNLSIPTITCGLCQKSWTAGLEDLVRCGYWPATVNHHTLYQVNMLTAFQQLKLLAPGLSRQAYLGMLEERSRACGRSSNICGDTFQRAFIEWSHAEHEVERAMGMDPFLCSACAPIMHAIAVDGNRKHYRFKNATGSNVGLFDGSFFAKDEEVASFVQSIHSNTKHTSGSGRCGTSQWAAAKEMSRPSSSKIDEEGLEIAVCRHGVLLRALNMFRGEIFAYPLYLHRELMPLRPAFLCMDVACKYFPYLNRVASVFQELQALQAVRPLLSVMHAKAHSWTCELKWGGRNQEGAGNTIGEEVEQVNSFLSRAAISTKYMSKGARRDMITVLAILWNHRKMANLHKILAQRYSKAQRRLDEEIKNLHALCAELSVDDTQLQQWISEVQGWPCASTVVDEHSLEHQIEHLYLSIRQRKHMLYRETDSNKRRHSIRRKIAGDKKKLESAIDQLDEAYKAKLPSLDDMLVHDNFIWPWESLSSSNGNLSHKKRAFDIAMLVNRFHEEVQIVVGEMHRHINSLELQLDRVKSLLQDNCEPEQNKIKRHIFELEGNITAALLVYGPAFIGGSVVVEVPLQDSEASEDEDEDDTSDELDENSCDE
ncbi:uncharacterized protein LOC134064287 isoform X2 [Sardina pilchardus]